LTLLPVADTIPPGSMMKLSYSNRTGIALAALMAFILSVCAPIEAGAGDPSLVFRTIETEHFKIHYHQGLERTARLTATICEEVYVDISIQFGWAVKGPIDVVITDSTDSANGSASVIYRPVIRLYATSPNEESSLQNHDHWLRTLITHEYTHITHIDIHGGVSKVINSVLGKVYLPNQISPRWFIEGIAVLNETEKTSFGRIRSAIYPGYLRTAAFEGTLLSLGELTNETRDFPRGSNPYIYGSQFMNFVHDRFGFEEIVEICHIYGDSTIPFGLNRAFKQALGVDLVTLYDEWIESIHAEAEATRDRLSLDGITESRRLTFGGESKGQPVFAPDGKSLFLAIGNGDEKAGVFQILPDGKKLEKLFLSSAKTPLSFDRSGRIYYTRGAPFKNTYFFHDVFVVNHPGDDPHRLTTGLRSLDVAVSPRGDELAVVINESGTTKLALADDRGNLLRTLVDSAPEDQVWAPSWSPTGDKIAAIIRRGAQVDLALVNPEDGAVEFITDDRSLESSPAFDASGRYLVFTSDRSGIQNIYAYDFSRREIRQSTNVLTGAHSPGVSPDGKTLAYLQYSTKGYDLHLTSFDPESAPLARPTVTQFEESAPPPIPATNESKAYNPLPHLLPHYWMVNAVIDTEFNTTLQALTALSDVVGRHSAALQVDYNIEDEGLSGSVAYSYSGLGPGLHIGGSRTLNPRDSGYTVGGESQRWVQIVSTANASLSVPVRGMDRSHSISLGYGITHAKPRDEPEIEYDPRGDRPGVPSQYFRAGLSLSWSLSDIIASPYGISPHKGRRLAATVNFNHPYLGSEQTLATFRYSWTEYLKMPWLKYHVLALRLNGGVNITDPPGQASFSVGGYSEQNILDTIWNNTPAGQPALRGYPVGAFQGSWYHGLKLDYRLPIWFTEAAYATVPVFLKRIQASVFTDNAVISFDKLNREDWRSAVGAEIIWHLAIGYYQPMSVRTGYAYGLMEGGAHEIILVIGSGF
jgi:WD40-like Beta Propeller Repeat